ncbi:LemA family protein [Lagierella sp.]|uniref:LemA family protein n=1 Tax=Lagierella sp. TaxID=2849657 RepID=UPI002604F1EE|nr:LemA family protein [Lagierella sp.]
MIIAVIVILVLLVLYAIGVYNSLVRLRENVRNSKSQIAAQIESRWDAIKTLIDGTSKYSDYEEKVLKDIVDSRSSIGKNSSVKEIEKDDQQFSNVFSRLLAIVENYPQLKASNLYENTMESINKYEDNVRHSRMIFNDTVTMYNRALMVFPKSLIASAMGFQQEEYFENTSTKTDMPSWK